MGVPSFYRWLSEKYPLILQDVIEEDPFEIDGVAIPVDTSKPNPNDIEYDNLYLDMNGIIHPCFHPEDKPSPTTFSEVFQCMFDYIDRLFVMVRPRKLLYLAIDGVAPRAKMNQQRSRRFRAAKDAEEAAAEEERLRQEFESEGRKLPPKADSQTFDSNVITPGTEFMSTLSFALQYYIHIRLNSDPGWKRIKVILSDANVPGEGEHKIMSYIRHQRNHPGYNPNARHCLYGLDADLIMLALATHEIHISILREVVFFAGEQGKCFACGRIGHKAEDCVSQGEMVDDTETDVVVKKPYQLVNIWTLREYLEQDMQIPNSRLQKLLDRIIDDFIFICFFVGNDFLPHMPTLEIREGAIELLMTVYKKEFGSVASYLSDGSKLNLKNVEHFIQAVGLFESNIFQKRAQTNQRQLDRCSRDRAQAGRKRKIVLVKLDSSLVDVSDSWDFSRPRKFLRRSLDDKIGVANVEIENSIKSEELDNREELKFKLKKLLREKSDVFSSGNGEQDKVRLGEVGWRDRYYEEKFKAKSVEEMEQIRKDVVLKYTEGLCWVMHYYYHGVCSWKWFYPYHYAPFASDLKFLDKLDIKFELGSPFKPFNQLLAVLPSASAHALPECYRTLMTDPNSPIADFYPPDFEVDMNGKRFSWQGIAKLPFIEEQRLLEAAAGVEPLLTNEEIRRNSVLFDMLFVVASNPLAELIRSLNGRTNKLSNEERATIMEKVDPELSEGMNGYLASCGGDSQTPCFRSPIEGMEDVLANQVICAIYKLPDDCRGSDFARRAPGVVLPKRTVQLVDIKGGGGKIWHEDGERRRAPLKITKIKRYNPEGSISGHMLGKAAHRLLLETINVQPDNSSEPALCPNAIFQNPQVPKKEPTFQKNAKENISFQSGIPWKKQNKSCQRKIYVGNTTKNRWMQKKKTSIQTERISADNVLNHKRQSNVQREYTAKEAGKNRATRLEEPTFQKNAKENISFQSGIPWKKQDKSCQRKIYVGNTTKNRWMQKKKTSIQTEKISADNVLNHKRQSNVRREYTAKEAGKNRATRLEEANKWMKKKNKGIQIGRISVSNILNHKRQSKFRRVFTVEETEKSIADRLERANKWMKKKEKNIHIESISVSNILNYKRRSKVPREDAAEDAEKSIAIRLEKANKSPQSEEKKKKKEKKKRVISEVASVDNIIEDERQRREVTTTAEEEKANSKRERRKRYRKARKQRITLGKSVV